MPSPPKRPSSLHARNEDVPHFGVKPDVEHVGDPSKFDADKPVLTSQLVYGNEMSLMVATRQPGYHSGPHTHDSEQLNYVADGELWFFIGERAYHAKKGDYVRVPRNQIHWAWNRSNRPVTLFEAHAPRLVRPGETDEGVGLYAEDETPAPTGQCENIFADPAFARRVEEQILGGEATGARA